MHIAFVSLSRKRYRYFSRIALSAPNGIRATVLGGSPGFSWFFSKSKDSNDELSVRLAPFVGVQFRRQMLNYPKLFSFFCVQKSFSVLALVIEKARFRYLRAQFKVLGISEVAVWNGQKPPYSTVVCAAESLGLPVWYFENGMASEYTTLDPHGVNAQSCIPVLGSDLFGLKKGLSKQASAAQCEAPLHVFIPLQVESDTQLVVHAGWVDCSLVLVQRVVDVLERLGLQRGYQVTVRPHPKARQDVSSLLSKFRLSNVVIDGRASLGEQLLQADVVVTINSSVGFEALREGLLVCHLAPCLYGREGVAYFAYSEDALRAVLKALADGEAARYMACADAFVQFVYEAYLIPGDWRQAALLSSVHFDAIWARFGRSDDLMKLYDIAVNNS